MKRKVLLLVLVILLILALTGCGMISPGIPEWMRAENSVYYYWQAIINRQYELAKYCCITDGIWYNKTDEWEEYINFNSEGEASVIIHTPHFYKQAEAIGNDAIVYATIYFDKIAFPDSNIIHVDTFEYEIELIKISPPGDWELK